MDTNESKDISAVPDGGGDDAKALEAIESALGKGDGDSGAEGVEGSSAEGTDKKPEHIPEGSPEGGESGEPQRKEPEKSSDAGRDGDDGEREKKDDSGSGKDELDSIDLDAFLDKDGDSFGELSVREWAAVIRGVRDMRSEIAELKSQLSEVGEYATERRREELDTRIDAAFEGLGEEFADIFGRGSARRIDRELVDNRNRVLREAGYLIEGHRRDGDELSLDDAIRKASLMLYGDRLSKRPASRKSQFIQRPSGGGNEERGDDAALRVIENFMKKDR